MYKFVDNWLGGQNHRMNLILNNEIVGYVNYSRGIDSAFINHIEVGKKYRRKGLGRKMVEELRAYYPVLRGVAKNRDAISFWRSVGGRFTGKRGFILGD